MLEESQRRAKLASLHGETLASEAARRYGPVSMFERNRIAETLRSAREKRGLSLEQAAAVAGIPTQYLRLLEGDDGRHASECRTSSILIPFFRKYARFVGIDAEEMLPEFLGMVQQMPGDGSPRFVSATVLAIASLWRPASRSCSRSVSRLSCCCASQGTFRVRGCRQ